MNLGSMFFLHSVYVIWLKGKWVKYFCCITSHSHLALGRKKLNSYNIKYEANNIFFQSERKLWVKESVCYISCALNENASFVLGFFFFRFLFLSSTTSLPTLMAHLLLHNPEKIRFSPFYGNCKYGDMEKNILLYFGFSTLLLCTHIYRRYINKLEMEIYFT